MSAQVTPIPDNYETNLAAIRLRNALCSVGVQPENAAEVQARHRREWPTLWNALDNLMAANFPGQQMAPRNYQNGRPRRAT